MERGTTQRHKHKNQFMNYFSQLLAYRNMFAPTTTQLNIKSVERPFLPTFDLSHHPNANFRNICLDIVCYPRIYFHYLHFDNLERFLFLDKQSERVKIVETMIFIHSLIL